jgi:hypothetical protein
MEFGVARAACCLPANHQIFTHGLMGKQRTAIARDKLDIGPEFIPLR